MDPVKTGEILISTSSTTFSITKRKKLLTCLSKTEKLTSHEIARMKSEMIQLKAEPHLQNYTKINNKKVYFIIYKATAQKTLIQSFSVCLDDKYCSEEEI